MKRPFQFAIIAAFLVLLFAQAGVAADGAWVSKVPPRDHERSNPYQDQPEAVAAGRRLFLDHCAQCHGIDAQGKGKKPSLRSDRIQQEATEGDIHWLLVNGNMKKGMPSWAKLPDPQLWQIIAYLRSLQTEPAAGK